VLRLFKNLRVVLVNKLFSADIKRNLIEI
jgi:hypothetical protein